jgi:hypothetical protein
MLIMYSGLKQKYPLSRYYDVIIRIHKLFPNGLA